MERDSYSIPEFCARHCISRSAYYVLVGKGMGPKTFNVGNKPLISVEAAERWRRDMESKSA